MDVDLHMNLFDSVLFHLFYTLQIMAWIWFGSGRCLFLLPLLTLLFLCSGVRPFGVSLLVAGFDDKGPQLYQVCHLDPDLMLILLLVHLHQWLDYLICCSLRFLYMPSFHLFHMWPVSWNRVSTLFCSCGVVTKH